MRAHQMPSDTLRRWIVAFGLFTVASPASAQWTRVADLPAADVFTVRATGDTLVAGTRTLAYVSIDGGASWRPSAPPGSGVPVIQSVLVRNGELYAGTAGQGVFVSHDLGQTWQGFNQGLVGGILNSQLDVSDLVARGDDLYASTFGAGVYARSLAGAGSWSHFGEEFEPNQASNVLSLALGGTRLLAMAGGNGSVFFRDPGQLEWTVSWLNNVGLHPGFQASAATWTGSGWVVFAEAGRGAFASVLGQEPWTFVNLNIGVIDQAALVTRGHRLFAAFDVPNNAVIEQSGDDGATWQVLDVLPNVFVYKLAMHGTDLYAGRTDGLWRRSTATVSVQENRGPGLRFALAGPQPVTGDVRLRFELPEAGTAAIEVFDLAGRRAVEPVRKSWPAGVHEVSLAARDLGPGIYAARLTAGDRQEVVRVIRVR